MSIIKWILFCEINRTGVMWIGQVFVTLLTLV